ncbi:hypothetical protein JHK86_038695 [Glycine max]|nr:hypothetical protein JHK86_038695 [Glycine max]
MTNLCLKQLKKIVQVQQVSDARTDHFIRDFNIKPNVILYHTHVNVVSKKQKQKAFDHKFIPVSRNGKSW